MPYSHATPSADQPAHDRGHPELLRGSAHGLPEGLATRVEGHLARFAEHLREGLLAASVAVGLEVMDELMAAEVTEVAGPVGQAPEGSHRDPPWQRAGSRHPGWSTPAHRASAGPHGRRQRGGAARLL